MIFKKRKKGLAGDGHPAPDGSVGVENPYLAARRAWNDHVAGVAASRLLWQVVGIISLLIALASVGGMIHIGSQSKFVPYVVEVDKLGQPAAVEAASRAAPVDQRVVHATLASFISDARTVTPDAALQRKAIFRTYALLAPGNPATQKMNEWFNGSAESNPFKRAAKETVSVEIVSVLPQTSETWQIDWVETVRNRQGALMAEPYRMRAIIRVFITPPDAKTTEEQMRNNPLGIYVGDYSWSKQI